MDNSNNENNNRTTKIEIRIHRCPFCRVQSENENDVLNELLMEFWGINVVPDTHDVMEVQCSMVANPKRTTCDGLLHFHQSGIAT